MSEENNDQKEVLENIRRLLQSLKGKVGELVSEQARQKGQLDALQTVVVNMVNKWEGSQGTLSGAIEALQEISDELHRNESSNYKAGFNAVFEAMTKGKIKP